MASKLEDEIDLRPFAYRITMFEPGGSFRNRNKYRGIATMVPVSEKVCHVFMFKTDPGLIKIKRIYERLWVAGYDTVLHEKNKKMHTVELSRFKFGKRK